MPTPALRMIAAATRLRDAWSMEVPDVVETHKAVLGLMSATGCTDLQAALAVFCDLEAGHANLN